MNCCRWIALIFVPLLLLPQHFAEAQERTYGLQTGLNITGFDGNDAVGAHEKAGFAFGGFLNYGISNKFSLQPEIAFSMKGANTDLLGGLSADFSIFYLEVPVLGKYSFKSNRAFTPHLLFGPAVSLYVGTGARTVVLPNYSSSYTEVGLFPDIDEPNNIDMGLVFGGGFAYQQFQFDVRYNKGLTGIDRERKNLDVRNRVFSVIVGYMFR